MPNRMLSLAPAVAIVAILTASAPCWADEPKPLVAVLVAKSDVAPWEPIEEPEKLFKVVHYLKGEEPRDAVTGFEQVKGRRINCRLTVQLKLCGVGEKSSAKDGAQAK
jgi:hypothetical protein